MPGYSASETIELLNDGDQSSDVEYRTSNIMERSLWRRIPVAGAMIVIILCGIIAAHTFGPASLHLRFTNSLNTKSTLLNEWQTPEMHGVKVFTVLAQASETCEDYPHITLLDIQHNNLGSHGPDTGIEGIRYLAKLGGRGRSQNLIVDIHAGSSYHPENSLGNGLSTGIPFIVTNKHMENLCNGGNCDKATSFGSINLHSGTAANMTFSFFDLDLKPLYLDEIGLTWFDLDHAGCTGSPSCEPEAVESVMPLGDMTAYITSSANLTHEFQNNHAVFIAKSRGEGSDNPINSRLLTKKQVDKAVTSVYTKVHEIVVTIGATASSRPAGQARYFFFDLVPSLLCAETVKDWPEWENANVNNTSDAPAPRLEHISTKCENWSTEMKCWQKQLVDWWWVVCLFISLPILCCCVHRWFHQNDKVGDARALYGRGVDPLGDPVRDTPASSVNSRDTPRNMTAPLASRPLGDEV